MTKQELRNIVKEAKQKLSPAEKELESKQVFGFIESMRAYKNANNILLYNSLPDELPTQQVLERWGQTKNIFLPRVNGDLVDVIPYSVEKLEKGAYGIYEPTGKAIPDTSIIDLVIVPAIALDNHCNRLGRGKGYYDRLIPTCANSYTIGVGFDCQFFSEVPTDKHDIPLCNVITASHISTRKPYQYSKQ